MSKLHRSPAEKGKKEFSLLSPKPNFEKFVFYLLVLLLPTQFGKHFWPPFSQILGIRVDYLSPTLYITDLIILMLFLIWLKRRPSLSPPPSSLIISHFSFLIFFAYLLLNILLSSNLPLGLYGFVKILELFFLGSYVAKNIKSKKELTIIATISAITVIGESLLAIAQYLHQGSLNGPLYFLGERKFTPQTPGIANASINGVLILRPYGTFSHPNVLAGFLLCALILIYSIIEDKKDIKKKILKTSALLLGSLALFLTLSRVAIVLWMFLVITATSRKLINQIRKESRHPALRFIFFALIICVSLLIFTPILPRLESTRLTEDAFTQRTQLLKSTVSIIMSSPLFGVGLHNFLPSLSLVQKPLSPILYLQPVHNIFLLITAEIGIIGLAFLLWFLFKTYKRLTEIRDNMRAILLILLSTVLILGSFDHYWLTIQQGQLLISLILGLCWSSKPATIKK